MKTITLNDSAYERLSSWKENKRDSFSKVVERMIPAKGTFEAVLSGAGQLPELSAEQVAAMEASLESSRKPIDAAAWN